MTTTFRTLSPEEVENFGIQPPQERPDAKFRTLTPGEVRKFHLTPPPSEPVDGFFDTLELGAQEARHKLMPPKPLMTEAVAPPPKPGVLDTAKSKIADLFGPIAAQEAESRQVKSAAVRSAHDAIQGLLPAEGAHIPPGSRVRVPPEEIESLKAFDNAPLKGLLQGTYTLGRGTGTMMDIAGQLTGLEGVQEYGRDVYDYSNQYARAAAPPPELAVSPLDDPNILLNPRWWAFHSMSMAPSLGLALGTATGAAKVIKIGGETLALTPQLVARLSQIGAAMSGGAIGGGLEGSETYRTVLEGGGTNQEALEAAGLMGLASTALNSVSVAVMRGGEAGKTLAKRILKFVKAGPTEGLTEAAEEPAEVMAISMALQEATTPEQWHQAARSAASVAGPAALTGGILGSGAAPQAPPVSPVEIAPEAPVAPPPRPHTPEEAAAATAAAEAEKAEQLRQKRITTSDTMRASFQNHMEAGQFDQAKALLGRVNELLNADPQNDALQVLEQDMSNALAGYRPGAAPPPEAPVETPPPEVVTEKPATATERPVIPAVEMEAEAPVKVEPKVAPPLEAEPIAEPEIAPEPTEQTYMAKLVEGVDTAMKEGTFAGEGPVQLRRWAKEHFGEDFTSNERIDQIYDALEAAMNKKRIGAEGSLMELIESAETDELGLPNRTRTLEITELQQFSTPHTIAEAAGYVADIAKGDYVLEPTAGTGNLIAPVARRGANVHANEIDLRRVDALETLGIEGMEVTAGDYLAQRHLKGKYDAIVTNPPWGAKSVGKYRMPAALPFKWNDISQRFLNKSLKDLKDGGRLVAVMPANQMNTSGGPFRKWLADNHTLRAVIKMPPDAYRARGTDVDSVLIVVDKGYVDDAAVPIKGSAKTWGHLAELIKPLAEGGTHARVRVPTEEGEKDVGRPATTTETEVKPAPEQAPPDRSSTSRPPSAAEPVAGATRPADIAGREPERKPERGAGGIRPKGEGVAPEVVPERIPGGEPKPKAAAPSISEARRSEIEGALEGDRLSDAKKVEAGGVFTAYLGRDKGSVGDPHPRLIVESAILAGMPYPALTYQPHPDTIKSAGYKDADTGASVVSKEQMDVIRAARQAHGQNKGILIADDVGVGKTREGIGIALDLLNSGDAKKVLYITHNETNVVDVLETARLLGSGSEEGDFPYALLEVENYKESKVNPGKGIGYKDTQPLPNRQGLYIIRKFNLSPYVQALLSARFDAMIVDEAHDMKNMGTNTGLAFRALSVDMLARDAKFTYMTATPADTVEKLEYLYGLKQWHVDGFQDWLGRVTGKISAKGDEKAQELIQQGPRPEQVGQAVGIALGEIDPRKTKDKRGKSGGGADFVIRIAPAEQEQVMRELKGAGVYISRDLARVDVTFRTEEVAITPEQEAKYDEFVELANDVNDAFNRYRVRDKQYNMMTIRGNLQFAAKRLLFDYKLQKAVSLAKDFIAQGKKPVIALQSVSATEEEGGHLWAGINAINTIERDYDDQGGEVYSAEIPEAVEEMEELRERLKSSQFLESPVQVFFDVFGEEDIANITGYGQSSPKMRRRHMELFQSGDKKIAIISDAGKIGISLHHVLEGDGQRVMIVTDNEWSSMMLKQLLGRVDRSGQLSSPELIYLHTDAAAEKKLVATIANRMVGLGAVAKGAAESTGTEALDVFAHGGDTSNEALREVYAELPNEEKALFGPKVAGNMSNPSPRTNANYRQFSLDLQLMPYETGNRIYDKYVDKLLELQGEGVSQDIARQKTKKYAGTIIRETKLTETLSVAEAERTDLTDREKELGVTAKMGILQGTFMLDSALVRLRKVVHNIGERREYVAFRDGDRMVSGLRIPVTAVKSVAKFYGTEAGGQKESVTDIWAGLQAGDHIELIHKYKLRLRKDGRIQIEGAKMKDKASLFQHGAQFSGVGHYWFIEKAGLAKFLDRFHPKTGPISTTVGQVAEETPPVEGNIIDQLNEELDQHLQDTTERGSMPVGRGAVQAAAIDDTVLGASAPDGRFHSADPDVDARVREAKKGIPTPSLIDKLDTYSQRLWKKATREFEHLPKTKEYAEIRNGLLVLEKMKGISEDRTLRIIHALTAKFGPKKMDLFGWKVLLDDLVQEVERGHDLPFGYTPEQIETDLEGLNATIEKNPDVAKAIESRKKVWKFLRDHYVAAMAAAGFDVEARLKNEDYYHHQVLQYASRKGSGVKGVGKKLKTPTYRGFLKKRFGSTWDINANYVEAEFEVMAQMLHDIKVADVISLVRKKYNITNDLRERAKEEGIDDWKSLLNNEAYPEYADYILWQPREGNTFYIADTLDSRIAQALVEGMSESIPVTVEDVGKALAMGGKYRQFAIKADLAAALEDFRPTKAGNVRWHRSTIRAWKQMQTIGPRRIGRFNIRNMTGDIEHTFLGAPGVFKYLPKAIIQLYPIFFKRSSLSGNTGDWADRGGMESVYRAQEIGDIKEIGAVDKLFRYADEASKAKQITAMPIRAFRLYWKTARLATDYREALLRYAAYLYYLDNINADGKPKNYGASIPEEIDGLANKKDKAFWLSNELVGPYDRVSTVGKIISEHFYPFWRWQEVNMRIYYRLARNAIAQEGAGQKAKIAGWAGIKIGTKGASMLIKMSMLWAAMQTYNNLFFKDEEDDLPEHVRSRPHIIFGRDKEGNIMYFARLGALGDALEWFGMDAGPTLISDWFAGRVSTKDVIKEVVQGPAKKLIGGLGPTIKLPFEILSRKSFFPEPFEPRPIRDRGSYVARGLGFGPEYQEIMDKPSPKWTETLSELALYKSEPNRGAYLDIQTMKHKFLEKRGKDYTGFSKSPRTQALYNFKLSLKYKRPELALKYYDEYARYGGTASGLKRSIGSMRPLANMSGPDMAAFVLSLKKSGDSDRLVRANKYYRQTLEWTGTDKEALDKALADRSK